jgi:glycosyltransferase involved in cell wall biosynthesis
MNKISLVIPTINLNYDVESVLKRESLPDILLDVIIVQQVLGVEESILCSDSFYGTLTIVRINQFGTSNARNVGIRQSRAEVIIFLDDDVVPCPGYLNSLHELYKNGNAEVAYGKIEYMDLHSFQSPNKKEFSYKRIRGVREATGAGSTLSVRRSSLLASGIWFDERIGGGCEVICGEDSVFCLTCFRAGLGVFRTESAVIYHPDDGSTIHLRTNEYFTSYWTVMISYYGFYGITLAIKFSLRLLIKERNFVAFLCFINSYFKAKKII